MKIKISTQSTHTFSPSLVSQSFSSSSSSSSSSSFCSTPSSSVSIYLNNADNIAPFTIIPPSSLFTKQDFELQIKQLITTILPSFFNDQENTCHVNIEPLGGGLSNHLYTATNTNTHSTILIRIHPMTNPNNASTIELINRNYENKIASLLSKYKIGPTFYGRFINGRIEEYYTNVKTLSYHEMSIPFYARGIGKQMSYLHSLYHDIIGAGMMTSNDDIHNFDGDIWSRIDSWLYMSKELLLHERNKDNQSKRITQDNLEKLQSIIDTIDIEWKWYKQEMKMSHDKPNQQKQNQQQQLEHEHEKIKQKAIEFCRQIVFTHMDCQSLNILTPITTVTSSSLLSQNKNKIIQEDNNNNDDDDDDDDHPEIDELSYDSSNTENSTNDNYCNIDSATKTTTTTNTNTTERCAKIHIIDYEYASFNRRVIDIANTFLEYCDMNNLKPNYELEYPSKEEQNVFLLSYLQQSCCFNNRNNSNESSWSWLNELLENDDEKIMKLKNEFLNVVREEITKHTLFSHLKWSCWSVIQSIQCNIDFDYVKYAEIRMEGYFYFKNLCWKDSTPDDR